MQIKRRIIILLAAFLLVSGISLLLNRASFDPDFNMLDVITGASEKSHDDSSEESGGEAAWGYSAEDLALEDEGAYTEEPADTGDGRYLLLRRADLPKGTLRILSDRESPEYSEAVQRVAAYYESLGYTTDVRECGNSMMLALAHAGKFDLFLLREEAES